MDWSKAIAAGQLAFQAANAYDQNNKANKLRKQGPLDITPTALKRANIAYANRANNARVTGYEAAVDDINAGIANALGMGKESATSSADVINLLARLNYNANRARNTLTQQGAAQEDRRLLDSLRVQEEIADYQDRARQENNAAIGAFEGAKTQNINNIFSGAVGLTSLAKEPTDVEDVDTTQITSSQDLTPDATQATIPSGREGLITNENGLYYYPYRVKRTSNTPYGKTYRPYKP